MRLLQLIRLRLLHEHVVFIVVREVRPLLIKLMDEDDLAIGIVVSRVPVAIDYAHHCVSFEGLAFVSLP